MSKDLLLIIDMQNVYGAGGAWYCPGSNEAGKRILKLAEEKGGDLDIALTRFLAATDPEGQWKQYNLENREVNEDAYANAFMEDFRELAEAYPVYTKSVYSSVAIPEVKDLAKKADRVLVSGVVAECCVLATVFGLIDEGCKVIYLTDAVAGIDEKTEAAVETVLSGLEPLHVIRMTTGEYLAEEYLTKQ